MSKINLPIAELKPALAGLGKIIQKRTTLPVLSCIRIDRTKDGWITLSGTDLDVFVTVRFEEPSTGEPTSILVPYEDLVKTTRGCSAGESLTIESAGKDAIIHYPVGQQTAQIKIASVAVEEFPPIPRIKGEPVPLNDDIRTSLLEAFDCASTDETRYVLQGAYIDVSDKKCHQAVATDGRHLYSSNSFSLPLHESIIIPTNKFLGWKEFNNDGEWQLRIEHGKKKDECGFIQISTRRWRFIHRQIDGNYPNWRQVVPKEFKTTAAFNDYAVISLIPRIPLDPKNVNKTIGMKIGRNKVALLGRSSSEDKWTEVEVAGVKTAGAPVTIYLNRDIMLKALKFGFNKLEIVDELTPMRFSSEGKQIIVMPLRADNGSSTSIPTKPAPALQPPVEEANGKDEVSSVHSQTSTERSTTMPKASTPTNGNGSNGHHQASDQPVTIDTALEQIETVKSSYREAIRGLNTLTDTLKQVQRGQKTTEKEVQSVRSTLEKLQAVRI